MINGHLSEAQQGFANLEDVDEETFVRFVHWAYNKDYPAPEHTLAEISGETSTQRPTREPPKVVRLEESSSETSIRRPTRERGRGVTFERSERVIYVPEWPHQNVQNTHGRVSWNESLRESFIILYDSSSRGYPVDTSMPRPRVNNAPEEDYSKVFLGHARVYVFAEKYDIQSLKTLALRKLHKTLSELRLFPKRVGDITKLLEYVYANTPEAVEGTEDIRAMLAHYVGCEMEMLMKDGEFKDLMLHNGDMLGDVLKTFASRASCQCPFLLCFSGRQAPIQREQFPNWRRHQNYDSERDRSVLSEDLDETYGSRVRYRR